MKAIKKFLKRNIFLKNWFLVFILIALSIYLFIFKLGESSLWNMDEAIYGEVAKEVLKLGDWVTLHFNYREWFDKPPLYIWLTAITFKVFGWSEFTTRLWSALSGMGGVIAVYFLGKSLFNRKVGFLSAAILATSPQYIIQSRLALLDVPLSFFISLSILFFYLAHTIPNKRWYYLLSYASMALATLTKGPIGLLLPVLIITVYLLLAGELGRIKEMMLFRGIILYLAIASPWYTIELIRHGEVFINNFFILRTAARFLTPFEGHTGPVYYYVLVLFLGFFPWSSFLPCSFIHLIPLKKRILEGGNIVFDDSFGMPPQRPSACSLQGKTYKFLVYIKKRWKSEEGKKFLLVLLWLGVVFVFFSSAKSKLPGYILPLYPPLALTVGKLWGDIFSQKAQAYNRGVMTSFGVLFALLVILLLAITLIAKPMFPVEYGLCGGDIIMMISGLIIGGAFSFLVLLLYKNPAISFGVMVGTMCFFAWILVGNVLPETEFLKPTKFLAGKVISSIKPGEKIGDYPASEENFMSFNPSLVYYTDHPVMGIDREDSLIIFLSSKERVYCLMSEKSHQQVRPLLHGLPIYVLERKGGEVLLSNKEDG